MQNFYRAIRNFIWISLVGLLAFLLVACSTTAKGTSNVPPKTRTPSLPVGQTTGFPISDSTGNTFPLEFPVAITGGPDGNLWFTEFLSPQDQNQPDQSRIGRITPAGKVTTFSLATTNTILTGITSGPDGNLWFTESADVNAGYNPANYNKVGYITPAGKINEFLLPTANSNPLTITKGPGGNLWFTENGSGKIGRMTPSGHLTEFTLPPNSIPVGITSGPDGNLWFTDENKIGRMTPTGAVKEFALPGTSDAAMIARGPDGNLWVTGTSSSGPNITSKIWRITPQGTITEFVIPNANGYSQGGGGYLYSIGFGPLAITSAPDGNLWVTGIFKSMVVRITPAGVLTEFPLPVPSGGSQTETSYGIASGPDGNLWITSADDNQIWRVTSGS